MGNVRARPARTLRSTTRWARSCRSSSPPASASPRRYEPRPHRDPAPAAASQDLCGVFVAIPWTTR